MKYIVKEIESITKDTDHINLAFVTKYKDEEMIKIKYIISDYIFKTSGARHITKEEISKCLEETIGYEARTNNVKLHIPDNILLDFLNDTNQRWIWE